MKGRGVNRQRMEGLVERWRRSGEPLAAFARAERITRGKLEYWRRRTGVPSRRERARKDGMSFAPVQLLPAAGTRSAVEVVLPDGVRIAISEDAAADLALAIIGALRRTC